MASAYHINIVNPSHSHFSPTLFDNLTLATTPIPTPGPNSILIRIRAVALNYRDVLILADSPLYPTRTSPGLIPCNDGAGEIVAAGPNSVWKDSIGDAVIVVPIKWTDGDIPVHELSSMGAGETNGTLAQYVVVEDPWVVRAPKNLTFEEAAALPGAAGTAINVLESVKINKGTTVVTQGTGGVSCAAIQYAAALGARVIATSAADEKLQIAKKLGASELINYRTTPEWADEVLRMTNGRGADLVCDVGGSGTVVQSVKALKQGGTACLVGFLTPPTPVDLIIPLILHAKTLRGILGYSRAMIEKTVTLAEEHDLHPHLGAVYEWEDAPKAFDHLRRGDFVGKIIIKV